MPSSGLCVIFSNGRRSNTSRWWTDILRTGSRDARHIECTLDGLLDFCGHEPVLEIYKQLCRHYWAIDPAAAADYIHAYRERWDGDEQGGQGD